MGKRIEVAWEVNENGCWVCTSHKSTKPLRGIGYPRFRRGRKDMLIHRFMYESTYGAIPEDMEVCHKCDNTLCINPEHLFLGTHTDNMHDMVEKNRKVAFQGENNANSKLTNEQVREIRDIKGYKHKEIAKMYNISVYLVNDIRSGRRWKHIQ